MIFNRRQSPEPSALDVVEDEIPHVAQVTSMRATGERERLGDVLVAENLITPEQVSAALNLQQASGRQLGTILVEQGVIDTRVLTRALAAQLGLPTIDLHRARPTQEAIAVIDEATARRYQVVPVRLVDGVLDVAIADGNDSEVRAILETLPVDAVNLHIAPPTDVLTALSTHYRVLSSGDDDVVQIWAEASPQTVADDELATIDDDAPIIQLVNKIVGQAIRDRASDIHIEPTDGRVRIRTRVDGALREMLTLPPGVGPELVSRIKVLAEMDIVERRRPQDGQLQMHVDGNAVDVRVATAATIWGETAVLRLLDKKRSLKRLSDLGMPESTFARFETIVHKPYGMILCSGPTGSGKTTTLYASLAEISREELNVMTIEDPVEYVFPAVNQMQISRQSDVTFATGLKSILRQDPDVILVGEIRDQETARIAVQSALTGHLVMSSLHATDASSALFRLVDMGVEPFVVASSLVGVIGQRLVRRVCDACVSPYEPSEQDLAWYTTHGGPDKEVFVRGAGCNFCLDTGFRDRVGVYEVLEVSDLVGKAIMHGASQREVRDIAVREGMRTMATEAMTLVAGDVTTIDEVLRNVYLA